MFDSHVHTSVSCDCDMPIEKGIERAKALNVGIVITDHMDINPFRGNDFTFDVKTFFNDYEPLRSDKVLLGIEMGLRVEAIEENARIALENDFDFVLGSTHAPYDMETPYEYYDHAYYEGLSKDAAYGEYFDSMLKGIKGNTYFDALAHIDYIARYSPYEDPEIYYDQFRGKIDRVLEELVRQDKSMEISTRRIADDTARAELLKIYRRFAELGGKTVTIGSDSHVEAAIANHFDLAMEMAAQAGLTVVYYKNRKQVVLDI